jgi:hypothetical protein
MRQNEPVCGVFAIFASRNMKDPEEQRVCVELGLKLGNSFY